VVPHLAHPNSPSPPPLACERIRNCRLKFNRLRVCRLFVALLPRGNRPRNRPEIHFLTISKSYSVIVDFLLTLYRCFSLMHFCSNTFISCAYGRSVIFLSFFSFLQRSQPFEVFTTNLTIISPHSGHHFPLFISLVHKAKKGSGQRTVEVGIRLLPYDRDGGSFLFFRRVVSYLICFEIMMI